MTPAEELRAAAAKLRETAKDTTPPDLWIFQDWSLRHGHADGAWMALMHPGLAEPLALVLEDAANRLEFFAHLSDKALPTVEFELRVARVITGTTPAQAKAGGAR